MTKRLYLPLLMALVVALSSCSSKMGELSSDYFTVTPQVLEAVGGKVPATINGKFPEKYFNKKAVVEVTPVLKWNGGEAKGQSAVFQGEKVEGNDQTISYKMGGNYTMKTSFDYVPEMAKSELYLEFKATIGNKTVTIPAVKVADGVISTSEMVEQTLEDELGGLEIGTWTKPLGGYFISFDALEGCAKAIVAKAKEAGVVMTGAGATFPYGKDPKDSNIRIAPSYPTVEELAVAAKLFALCVKLVSVEKILESK